MDELRKLVGIIKKHGQRSLQIIEREYKTKHPTKDTQLYQALVSDDFESEEDLVKKIFRTDKNDRNYKITKTRLKEKLLNNLFLLDYHKSDFTEFQRAEYDCLHVFHQGKILMMEGDSENAVRILAHAVKKAIRFGFYSIAYSSLLLIRKQYAIWGKNSMFEKLTERISKVKIKMLIQEDFEERVQRIMASVSKSHNAALSVRDDIVKLINKLKSASDKNGMQCLDIQAEKLKIILGWINLEYNSILEACEYLEKKYFQDDITQISVDIYPGEIYKHAIKSYHVLKEYKAGLDYLSERKAIAKKGTCDWYWLEEYKLLLLLGNGQLDEAANVLVELKSCRQSSFEMDSGFSDRLNIYRLHLLYFLPDEKQLYWGFHWEELIREHPDFLNGHRSYLVSYLILQYIYFLRKVEISELRETLELLKPFSTEHLSRKNNYRTSILIRMLEIVSEKNFDHEAIIDRCSNYSKKLKDSRLNPDMDHEFEVIPYENLWAEIHDPYPD